MRDLAIVLSGRALQVLTSLLTLRLVTWRLDQEEMGRFALLIALFTFFSLVFVSPIGAYINRQLHGWDKDGIVVRILAYGLIYLFVVCFLADLILWLLADPLTTLVGISINWLMLIVAVYLLVHSLNQLIIPSLNLLGKRLSWMLLTLFSLWAGLAASVYLTGTNASAEYWMIGQITGFALGSILGIGYLLRALNQRGDIDNSFAGISWTRLKPVVLFALPLSVVGPLYWFQFQSFRFFFGEMVSLAQLGIFAAGYTISAGILGAFETTAQQYFLPGFYRSLEGTDRAGQVNTWSKYASLMIPTTLLFVVFIIVLAKPLLMLLVDEKYWGAGNFVVIAALLEASRVIGNTYGMAAHALKSTRTLLVPQVTGAVLMLVLVPLLLNNFGEPGFLAALAVSSAIYLLLMRRAVTRLVGAHPKLTFVKEFVGCALTIVGIGIVSLLIDLDYVSSGLLLLAGLAVCAAMLWRVSVSLRGSKEVFSDLV
jgi:O-antigen/teichoic acid export membrane protein